MSTKTNDPCLNNVAADEPIFVLRAQDLLAPTVVEFWITLARQAGSPEFKLQDAKSGANSMRMWQLEHSAKIPD